MSNPKFIIRDDELILGKVVYHADLTRKREGIKGGGWWQLSEDNSELLLFGTSTDFGSVTKEQIIEVFSNGSIPHHIHQHVEKVFYSPMPLLRMVEGNKELLLLRQPESIYGKEEV